MKYDILLEHLILLMGRLGRAAPHSARVWCVLVLQFPFGESVLFSVAAAESEEHFLCFSHASISISASQSLGVSPEVRLTLLKAVLLGCVCSALRVLRLASQSFSHRKCKS